MNLVRNTYAEINLKNIEENIKKIVRTYNTYKYYFAVIKADSYGLGDINNVEAMIKGGCNYLAVATLEEALKVREKVKNVPILCFGVVPREYLDMCIENNIAISINSLGYLKEIEYCDNTKLKVHVKINTGMNRLGISCEDELKRACEIIREKGYYFEGIYTHIYNALNKESYLRQIEKFETMLKQVKDLDKIPIIHVPASQAVVLYEKPAFVNGCRLGKIMYGFSEKEDLGLKSTFRLCSEVIQINEVKKGETVRI